jgi:hypothetical protein
VLRFIASAGAAQFKTNITAQSGSVYNIGTPTTRFGNASIDTVNASTVQFFDPTFTTKWYVQSPNASGWRIFDNGNVIVVDLSSNPTRYGLFLGDWAPSVTNTYDLGSATLGGGLRWKKLFAQTASLSVLPIFANNAAAVAGGLVAGDLYRTGADPDPVSVVH